MSKFKVIEVRQKITEAEKMEATIGIINSLAALGSALGVKTQALYTMTGMMGNIKSIIKDAKTLWNIKKETKGLDANTLSVAQTIKNKGLYPNIEKYVKSTVTLKPPKPVEPITPSAPTTKKPTSKKKADSPKQFLQKMIKKGLPPETIATYKKRHHLENVNNSLNILKEIFSLKTSNNEWINANTFLQNIRQISSNETKLLDNEEKLIKATNLTREQLKPIIDKLVQTFMVNKGLDYFKSIAEKNPNNFTDIFSQEFEKFLKTLANPKNTNDYYAKYGNNAEYMKESDEKIWDNAMNDKEKQDWARVWLGLKPTASITPGAAEKLFKFRYEMMKNGKSEIDERDLAETLKNMGIK